jgi:large subunit ribosomal protein L22
MTDEPDKTEDIEPTSEATEAQAEATEATQATAAEAAGAGADAPAADAVDEEPSAEEEPAVEEEPAAEVEPAEEEPVAEAPVAATQAPARPARQAGPTPSRRRARRDPNQPVPVVRAQARYVRSSARKARLVCDNIRGKSVEEARAILALTPRAIAQDWSKLLESAVANAEHNHELVGEDLYVKAVHADEGPTIKRFRPRAMGRATRIRKRTSHLTILLTPKD